MQTKLLINNTPIRKPMTGIEYYTLNILSELLRLDTDVFGLQNGRSVDRHQPQALTDSFLIETERQQSQKSRLSALLWS